MTGWRSIICACVCFLDKGAFLMPRTLTPASLSLPVSLSHALWPGMFPLDFQETATSGQERLQADWGFQHRQQGSGAMEEGCFSQLSWEWLRGNLPVSLSLPPLPPTLVKEPRSGEVVT